MRLDDPQKLPLKAQITILKHCYIFAKQQDLATLLLLGERDTRKIYTPGAEYELSIVYLNGFCHIITVSQSGQILWKVNH